MPFLLRVSLPDVPGSLGRVATAIGEAGGDIEAIEIVDKRGDVAVDDVLLETLPGTMPDSIVSACNALDGVEVLWISRYAAGGNLFLDLEVVEELSAHPAQAIGRLVEMLPITFRVDWAARVGIDGRILQATDGAPEKVSHVALAMPDRLPSDDVTLLCGAPLGDDVIVLGRRGGPDFLESELARLGHLLGLAQTISRA
ncbi:amino acid-binding protein [Nocardioides gansuensis]|uniref:Amino acid-binding protein n=1 Tax=Nocardioides gansuensis TaxID=2138300 RepID=A0A2T8F9D8_9ACTN|nr:ACT domain-containing protein [Nocardioides gansuensis]PVG82344.1 amino acid-binding protein [Nocardioides gansuensis]